LRRYEPIVRFTRGEQFFPSDVDRYLRECSLWAHYPDGREEELVPDGQLDEAVLTAPRAAPFRTVFFLKLVGALNLGASAQALRRRAAQRHDAADRFVAGQGRLARVGYTSRLVDALFSTSLLLRGRVPGATAAVAELIYQYAQRTNPRYVYYGRVIRESGWVTLQYWYFYFYNGWRSGFHGVNDHESDWEQVLVYLYADEDGALVPQWTAYASHDYHGDDLRRRWDDRAELDLVGTHPVVYAGAGSHASYFRRGEYQTDVSLPLPVWLARFNAALSRFWTQTLGQSIRGSDQASPFRIPFVDFARGDGLSIGPGEAAEWTPVLMDPVPAWVTGYRGLWGLFARDPISGENAPAGPMYNRDGSVRAAWYDPLGFAGLDKVPPPPVERRLLATRRADVALRQTAIQAELATLVPALQEVGAQLAAMQGNPHLARPHHALAVKMQAQTAAVAALRREHAENQVLIEALDRRIARPLGASDPPHAHITHLAHPASSAELRFSRLAELWAALSIGLLAVALVGLIWFLPNAQVVALAVILIFFVLIESVFRGTFTRTVNAISVILALIAFGILLYTFWWQAIVVGILAAGAFLLLENLRELRA
jgi:hypothetical protein